MENDHARLESIEARLNLVEAAWAEFETRVTWLEHLAGIPTSTAQLIMAETRMRQREEAYAAERRRTAAYVAAKAEAERTGSQAPIDRFVKRLAQGEFDRATPGG
jgi:hypothetical protein